MELWQRLNWGISMSYEFTLGDWMLSKINNKLVGSRNTVVVWNCSDHLQHWLWPMENWGRSRGSLVEPPKLIFTNVSKRTVSDEKLTTNHCDTCNALKIVCLCLLNMKRAKITWIWRKSVPGWLKLTVSFSRVANYKLAVETNRWLKGLLCRLLLSKVDFEYEYFFFPIS